MFAKTIAASLLAQSLALALALALALSLAGPGAAQEAQSEETIDFFQRNCASCHTVGGGRLTGPDLKGLSERRDEAWTTRFLLDPKGVLDSGGEYEQQILREARGVYMPPAPGMTKDLAAKLWTLIEQESAKDKSLFAGIQVSDRPLTMQDVVRGRELFLGQRTFQSGAVACVSCHSTATMTGLGGGNLGPDLTAAYARLEGRTALAAWLSAPPSPTMQPVYAGRGLESEEILALVAYLQAEARTGVAEGESRTLPFILASVALAAGLLVIFDLAWKNRFRGVRRPLVHEGRNA